MSCPELSASSGEQVPKTIQEFLYENAVIRNFQTVPSEFP
jgi:hypothetical protein